MPAFSETGRKRLEQCDPRLQRVFNEVVKHFDCSVLCGHRGEAEQNEAFRSGTSTQRWPASKHNSLPSKAVDVAPYPVKWDDVERFRYFSGFVMGVASQLGIKLRWGGDWDGDTDLKDQNLIDLPHFEVVDA